MGMHTIVRCGWVLTMLKPFNQRELWNSAQQLILRLHKPSICLDKTLLPWSNNFLYQMLRRLIWQPCDSSLYSPAGLSGYNKRKSEFKKRTVITLTVHNTVLSQDWQCRVKGTSTMKILYHIVRETNKDSCRSMVAWNKYWPSFYFVIKAVLRDAASIWMFTGAQRCVLLFLDVSRNQSHDVHQKVDVLLKYCPGLILKRNKSLSSLSYNPRLLKMGGRKVSN